MIHTSCEPVPAVKHLWEASLGPASRELKNIQIVKLFNYLLFTYQYWASKTNNKGLFVKKFSFICCFQPTVVKVATFLTTTLKDELLHWFVSTWSISW